MVVRFSESVGAGRHDLQDGWEFCATAAGAFASLESLTASDNTWISTTVPSTAASALRAHGLWSLEGPERRFDSEDWWYRLQFEVLSGVEVATLGFDGLATLCEAWLNGKSILTSDNMFRSHEVTVTGIRPGTNELVLVFRSLDAALKARRPRPRWRAPMIENQQLRWHRTTLLGRTPGWSPPAAPVGPWRPVWIAFESPEVSVTRLHASAHDRSGRVGIQGALSGRVRPASIQLRLHLEDKVVAFAEASLGADTFEAELQVADIEHWWPHTHGTPARYGVSLRVTDAQGAQSDLPIGQVGFRSIAAFGDPADLSLKINGTPVFCRGACWTPIDVVALRSDPQAYRAALRQVREAGFNMIRLSGAFIYEDDALLDLCDELGILVWQDFMFANMDYPDGDPGFAESVRVEALQHLARWQRHPCIAVICGNSEVSQQAAMWGAPRDLWDPALFEDTLRRLVAEICPGVPYWPSSASGGELPFQVDAGTTSYYGVGAYLRPLEDARRSGLLFATECLAVANVPEPETLDTLPGGSAIKVHHPAWKRRVPRDLGAGWDFDDVRDHYLRLLFAEDPLQLRYADHGRYLALSRRVSAEMMAYAFAEWRRRRSSCKGALIWFLRDLWPGAGWGIIDALGRPKAPWYALRRRLQSQWLDVSDEGLNGVVLHAGNESSDALAARIELEMFRHGRQSIARASRDVTIPPRDVLEISGAGLLNEFHDVTHAYRFGPASCDLVVATLLTPGGAKLAQAIHLPRPDLHSRPAVPDLLVASAVRDGEAGCFELTIRSSAFARSVHVDAPGFSVEDQYFDLVPGSVIVLRLRARESPAPALLGTVAALNSISPARIEVRS